MLGVHSVLYRSSMARGGTVLSFLFLALAGMVYAQASEVRVANQDPVLSIVFILAVLGFMEGMNWRNRYASMDHGQRTGNLLLARQVGFTLVFMGIGAVVALAPFLIGDVPRDYYESTTILGKALVGLMAISPIAVLALVRNLFDR
jgi:peptidoglycan/LPS O-acetylase OafA/YrhL